MGLGAAKQSETKNLLPHRYREAQGNDFNTLRKARKQNIPTKWHVSQIQSDLCLSLQHAGPQHALSERADRQRHLSRYLLKHLRKSI
jgi:hypothetical protein